MKRFLVFLSFNPREGDVVVKLVRKDEIALDSLGFNPREGDVVVKAGARHLLEVWRKVSIPVKGM